MLKDSLSFNLIFQYLGGSHLYGLETEKSDTDIRGVFLNNKMSQILGWEKFEHFEPKQENAPGDLKYKELRAFLKLVRQGNIESIEALFAATCMKTSPEWELIKQQRNNLLDCAAIFRNLRGFALGEKNSAFPEDLTRITGRRLDYIKSLGYYPKAAANSLRLLLMGSHFFDFGIFQPNIEKIDKASQILIKSIKESRTDLSDKMVLGMIEEVDRGFLESFDKRKDYGYSFKEEMAVSLMEEAYLSK